MSSGHTASNALLIGARIDRVVLHTGAEQGAATQCTQACSFDWWLMADDDLF
jgi:hypothetical protein